MHSFAPPRRSGRTFCDVNDSFICKLAEGFPTVGNYARIVFHPPFTVSAGSCTRTFTIALIHRPIKFQFGNHFTRRRDRVTRTNANFLMASISAAPNAIYRGARALQTTPAPLCGKKTNQFNPIRESAHRNGWRG